MKIKLLFFILFFTFLAPFSYSLDSMAVTYDEALEELQNKNFQKAVEMFTAYIKATGNNKGYYQRGNAYFALEDYDHAITDFTVAYQMGYLDAIMLLKLGQGYKYKKDFLTAASYLQKAIDLRGKLIDANVELGEIYFLMEQYDDSRSNYETVLSSEPDRPEINFALGKVLIYLNSNTEAISYLEKAIKLKGDDVEYYNTLSTAYLGLKDTADAIGTLNAAVLIDRKYAQGYYRLANIYKKMSNYYLAIDNYSKAIEIGSPKLSTSNLYKERGFAYKGIDDSKNALEDFESAIQLNPLDTVAYLEKAKIDLLENNDTTAALEDFRKIIAIDPNIGEVYSYRSTIYLNKRLMDAAESDLRKTVEFIPGDTVALFNLGNILIDKDNYLDAIKYYTMALSVNPNFKIIYENRGIANYNLGNYKQAAADFEAAMKYNPQLVNKLRPLYLDAKSK